MKFFNRITDRFVKIAPLPEGLHHMQSAQDETPYRIHLRLLKNGSGILIVNAATVLQLNPTAAEYAYHYIKGSEAEQAANQVSARYRVNKATALKDYLDFVDRIQTLISTPDLDPVSFLDFERAQPYSADLAAPLRLDCALTYRLPADSNLEFAPTKRVNRELSTDEWKTILDKAWQAGIPHVTFTGGEPTLRTDLPELIAHAEKNGQVCGLLSNGQKLIEKDYLQILLQTGLDHLLFLLQPQSEASWNALKTIMAEDLFVTVHITINGKNAGEMHSTLNRLEELEVKSLSLSLAEPSLKNILEGVRNRAADRGLSLTYDLPVPYSEQNPVALETKEDGSLSGAGKAWLYIEPDGDVLPAQGMASQVMGNLLKDDFEKILSKK